MWRSCWPSEACTPITSRCGDLVQRYATEMERRLLETQADHRQSAVDETYIRIKGKWRSLYRAVDSNGATLDFLLSAKQDATAAKRFLAKERPGY